MASTKNARRPGFSFLVSQDTELLKEQLESLANKYLPANGTWEKYLFWGDEEPDNRYWEMLGQAGLFSTYRMVLVRKAHEWNTSIWKNVSSALARGHDSIWPIFCLEVEFEKGKFKIPAHILKTRCFNFADKQGWVWRQQNLAGPALQNFVNKHAAALGLSFSEEAFALFCECVMPSASAIKNELEKLVLTAKNGKVDKDLISIDAGNPEANAFNCIKNLESGNFSSAWLEASRANASSLLFFLIALLSREFRMFWSIAHGGTVPSWQDKTGDKQKLAHKLGLSGIAKGFSALANAEWTVKSGNQTPEQSLETLCVEMSKLFSPANKII